MPNDPCTEALSKVSDKEMQQVVFDAFNGEGLTLITHDMLRRVVVMLNSSRPLLKDRRALAGELAKLAPGKV